MTVNFENDIEAHPNGTVALVSKVKKEPYVCVHTLRKTPKDGHTDRQWS